MCPFLEPTETILVIDPFGHLTGHWIYKWWDVVITLLWGTVTLELANSGRLAKLANHKTTRGIQTVDISYILIFKVDIIALVCFDDSKNYWSFWNLRNDLLGILNFS